MPLVKAFPGLRPAPGRAAEVAAPPYDVMNESEARAMVAGRPWSFLHISRPEVDLLPGTDPYAPEVYAKARDNLALMVRQGILVDDPKPCFYVYRLTMGTHQQTGLVGVASVKAYQEGRIKKHEFTRPVKEDDRVRQIEALNAQTGPVFLVYRSTPAINDKLAHISSQTPEVDITDAGGVRHELWIVDQAHDIVMLEKAFDHLGALYVADGHHRSAAASRVADQRNAPAEDSSRYFLSVIFPHDQMQIMDYNRVVRDLCGETVQSFLDKVRQSFQVTAVDAAFKPQGPAQFAMYLERQWYRLELHPQLAQPSDPVQRLDVSLLARYLIEPILGIADPRRDDRIDFVGGIRGLAGLQQRVDSGEMAVAFALYPTQMEDLMAVADSGQVMPPKSTWFEPKLADGLVSHRLGA